MDLTIENILLIGSLLLFVSIVASKTSHRFGVPILVLFLTIGMLAGTDGILGIEFNDPKATQFVGVIALNFILFSGGLDTDWKAVKPILRQGIILSTLGVILTAVTLGLFVFAVTDFTIYESLLLGSIVSSTDVAAVFSILRSKSLALKHNLRPTLELESGSNDPMAYVLTIVFLTLVINQDQSFASVIPLFFRQMIFGGIAGFVFGFASKHFINRINLQIDGLYPVLVIALMFITFSATDFIGGNGFLAIYICALYLGNHDFIQKKSTLKIFDGFAWLMQIVLFLTLGLLVNPSDVLPLVGIGLMVALFLILVARPVSVFLCLAPFKMRTNRKAYIAWVGLRGAVPIVFATYPLLAGIDKAHMIFNIVFFISVTSVLIQGTTLSPIAEWLKVGMPEEEKQFSDTEKLLLDLPKTHLQEIKVSSQDAFVDRKIVDLAFPTSSFIVMIERGGSFIRPGGSTRIREGDVLSILSDDKAESDLVMKHLHNFKV